MLACAAAGAKTQRSRPRQQPPYLGLDPRAPPGIWRPALPSQKETMAVEGMLALETECPPFEPQLALAIFFTANPQFRIYKMGTVMPPI